MICVLNMCNGIFSIARVALLFQLKGEEEAHTQINMPWFLLTFALEIACFNICQWLYAFKSYYNSREIKLMFREDSGGAAATVFRKQIY